MDALELFATPPAAPSGPLVRVALPVPLGRAFTYAAGPHADVAPGARVLVEFGRRKCIGVVIERDAPTPPDLDPSKLKPLLGVLDREPALSPELLGFCLALGRYYLAPIGEVLRLALPALERSLAGELENLSGKKFKAVGRLVQVVEALPSEASIESLAPSLGRGSGAELLTALRQEGPLEVARASERFRGARSAMKKLVELGLARMDKRAQTVDPFFAEALVRDEPPRLNDGQTRAVESLTQALTTGGGAFLLDGVTASGKTEVYLHVAEQALRSGRGVLLLVPEIALTPQLVGRFRARLGDAIAVLHSELSETARLEMWKSLKSGERRVVVGARSALFAPLRDLALICVDEEHDPSYKQEEGVRYNARDMALVRAKRAGAVCVLGSATPSLTSELAVREGKLTRLVLSERARQAARLPQVELIDLKRFGPGPSGDPLLSLPLHRALEDNLAAGGQSILFLNRRGFAPSLVCEGCGEIRRCPNCSVPLTLHRVRGARLECHYCDHHEALGPSCPACGSPRWVEEGAGTERIETLLKQHFPTARVGRLDRDVARGQRGERVIESMRRGELDILIGTQMVTKGHDLPAVTLVGVLNADAALSLPDFRAAERTFQLLVQVAGRAGRADQAGRVLIQTRNPEHPAVACAAQHDVRTFVEAELEEREEVGHPPFSRAALVRFEGTDEPSVRREAERWGQLAERQAREVRVFPPTPAPLARLRNRYRYHFFLRSTSHTALFEVLRTLARASSPRSIKVSIDVDPMTML